MSNIHTLPQEIVSKIAAGQVVERPASVVKELIENSIDAGADEISIEVTYGGMQLIRVVDNGSGMSSKDLQMSALPHTTSKILTSDDLTNIRTLGFRGEALSSIASMSELVIKSRSSNEEYGTEIKITSGKPSSTKPIGMQKGTIVEVRNLFANVPARKNDLKSEKLELKQITDSVMKTALAYPGTSFKLSADNKIVSTVNIHTQRERIEKLLGEFMSSGLMPVSAETGSIKIKGFIGTPQLAIKQKNRQFLYVNNRPVTSDLVSNYIKDTYGTLIDPRLHPAFVIFIETPPDLIDVNVHPRKETVSFYTADKVLESLSQAISSKLKKNNLTYNFNIGPQMSSKTAFVIKDAVSKWSIKAEKLINNRILQVDNTFLVAQTNSNLLIIDQHAAHERILFEQFSTTLEQKNSEDSSIELHKPILIQLPITEMQALNESKEVLNNLGFEFISKKSGLYISKIPEIYVDRDLKQLISEVSNNIAENNSAIDSLTHRTLSYLSCKSAIRAGDELTEQEATKLLNKLFKTKTNYTCPHGRPVLIEIPLSQLHIAFRRK